MNNIDIFLSELDHQTLENQDRDLQDLMTSISPNSILLGSLAESITCINKEKREYILHDQNKNYLFRFLQEEENIQMVDREILSNSDERDNYHLIRILKLACSLDLINPRVIIGSNKTTCLCGIIIYEKNNQEMVIDYRNNLIMNKDHYYELFDMKEINRLSRYDIYLIDLYRLEIDKNIQELLFFNKEMFKDLSRNMPAFNKKYDDIGINQHNFTIWGHHSDVIFTLALDHKNLKYGNIQKELDEFTLNPTKSTIHVNQLDHKAYYQFMDDEFGEFKFSLISDFMTNDKMTNELLSEKRYNNCHENVHKIASYLKSKGHNHIFITSGKIKLNDQDSIFHSWVELELEEGKFIVFDYNRNLIMEEECYNQLYEVKTISKIELMEMMNILEFTQDNDLCFSDRTINFLGPEIYKSSKKNEKIFKRS